jgi:hypothetical protein
MSTPLRDTNWAAHEVRALLREHEITVRAFATAVGVHEDTMWRYLGRGRSLPVPVAKLAQLLLSDPVAVERMRADVPYRRDRAGRLGSAKKNARWPAFLVDG